MGYEALWPPVVQSVATSNKSTSTSSLASEQEYQTSLTEVVVLHTVSDDGAGNLSSAEFGTVNYATGEINVRLVRSDRSTSGYKSDYEDAEAFENSINVTVGGSGSGSGSSGSNNKKGGEYYDKAVSEEIYAGSTLAVSYQAGRAGVYEKSMTYRPPQVTIDLCPYTTDYIVPNSVRFTWMGTIYEDFEGIIYRGRTAGDPGIASGYLNYSSGIAEMFDYVVAGPAADFVLNSMWTQKMAWNTSTVLGRTQSSPVAPSGFVMQITDVDGIQLTATAGNDGLISGTGVRGAINYQTGAFELQFGAFVSVDDLTEEDREEWWHNPDDVGAVETNKIWKPRVVDPRMLRYNAVTYFYLPLDASILGIDPVRLPQDGRVPVFRRGGFAVVGNTKTTSPATVSNSQTIDLARTRLSRIRVIGSDNLTINTGYTEDLEAGTVTFTDVTGYAQPVRIEHRIEDMVVVADVQIDGSLQFTRQLTHDYPAGESYISSAYVVGDVRARTQLVFDQTSWNNIWQDSVNGTPATGTYDTINHPIVVTNAGAMTERWALLFTNSSNFNIIGEHLGVIGTGSINTTTSPINPISGEPYFTIDPGGWGAGWATGNVVRINTIGAMVPFWIARTVQPGPEGAGDYTFEILVRGDVDAPPPSP